MRPKSDGVQGVAAGEPPEGAAGTPDSAEVLSDGRRAVPPSEPLDELDLTPGPDPTWRARRAPVHPEEVGENDFGGLLDAPSPEQHAAPTVPPPVPVGEYVSQMMRHASPSSMRPGAKGEVARMPPPARMPSLAERHRAILEAIDDGDEEGAFDRETVPQPVDPFGAADVFDHAPLGFPGATGAHAHRTPRPALDELDDVDALPEALRVFGGGAAAPATPVAPRHPTLGDLSMAPSTEEARVATISDIPMSMDSGRGDDLALDAAFGSGAGDVAAAESGSDTLLRERLERIQDRFAVGDYTGSLALAETALEQSPTSEEALAYVTSCREMLLQMYESRVGDRSQTPRVVMPPDQLRWLTLDHRGGFLLSCIDGMSSIDEILDVSGMAEFEVMRILCELIDQGVVQIGRSPRSSPRR